MNKKIFQISGILFVTTVGLLVLYVFCSQSQTSEVLLKKHTNLEKNLQKLNRNKHNQRSFIHEVETKEKIDDRCIIQKAQDCASKVTATDKTPENVRKFETTLNNFASGDKVLTWKNVIAVFQSMDYFNAQYRECLVSKVKDCYKIYITAELTTLRTKLSQTETEITAKTTAITQKQQQITAETNAAKKDTLTQEKTRLETELRDLQTKKTEITARITALTQEQSTLN